MKTSQITIKGIVQGVGFRPFVYSLADNLGLTGKVWNTSSGVEIVISGKEESIDTFLSELQHSPPPLAQIDSIEIHLLIFKEFSRFEIIDSQSDSNSFIPISPDICICDNCRRELFDPHNRRFRYPFINCTNCGPRLTIIKDIPYDRPQTTMAEFSLCAECHSEYDNPLDRRFHAQPVACEKCGPELTFVAPGCLNIKGEEALQMARTFLKQGKIVAIKGLGGYHIACDASNESSVSALIERKQRSEKPLALMAFDVAIIKKYCELSIEESDLLISRQHPIVLLHKKPHNSLPDKVAINQDSYGFMLPYTPLHLLLLEPEASFPEILVMTSGNFSEEPIAYEDKEAFDQLSQIVDGYLTHNRDINIRVDDSVMRIYDHSPYFIRRSRGYSPNPIRTSLELPEILACGAELKNTFCLSKSHYAFLSHHIGDLENYETLKSYETGIEYYKKLFRVKPQLIAADLHPDYLSTKYAANLSLQTGIPLLQIQHHHAHLAACLADNNWDSQEPVIGCILDGTGYGTDGTIWGGEFLTGSYIDFTRQLHLQAIPLPGGDSSIKQPAKIGVSCLIEAGIELENQLPPIAIFDSSTLRTLRLQVENRINTPMTTSMGRLFDAVAAIIGLRQKVSYEAQAAIELENCCDPSEKASYGFEINDDEINFLPMIRSIVDDWRIKTNQGIISAKFHNTIAQMCIESCVQIRKNSALSTVALSGGVWQNITLLSKTIPQLEDKGFKVLIHRQVPTNDGGLSLGQLLIASHSIKQ